MFFLSGTPRRPTDLLWPGVGYCFWWLVVSFGGLFLVTWDGGIEFLTQY